MKMLFLIWVSLTVLIFPLPVAIAEDLPAQKYEYAVVKWDGPDRLYFNLPDKFELVYLGKAGVTIPRDAQAEEFCLAYAANKMAKDNWYVVALDSRRMVFRRVKQ